MYDLILLSVTLAPSLQSLCLRATMKLNYTIFGVFVGSILGFLLAAFGVDLIIQTARIHIATLFVAGLVLLLLLAAIYLAADGILGRLLRVSQEEADQDFTALEEVLRRTLPMVPADGRNKVAKLARIAGARMSTWRLRGLIVQGIWGVAVVFGGLVATFVLVRQNELFETQNTFLNRQIVLQESSRFSVYAPLVTDILADIAREGFEWQAQDTAAFTKQQEEFAGRSDSENLAEFDQQLAELGAVQPTLTPELAARITAVLAQLEPYPYLATSRENVVSGDIAQSEVLYLSPERGNILETLIRFQFSLDPFREADFTYADMRNKNLQTEEFGNYIMHAYLGCNHKAVYSFEGLDLSFADFRGAKFGLFEFTVQEGMQLDGATFEASIMNLPDGRDYGLRSVSLLDTKIVNLSGYLAPQEGAPAIDLDGVVLSAALTGSYKPCIQHFVNTSIMELDEIAPLSVTGLKMEFQLVGDEEELSNGVFGDLISSANEASQKPLSQALMLALFSREDTSKADELEATNGPTAIFARETKDVTAYARIIEDPRAGQILTVEFK